MGEALRILNEVFGYPAFRGQQAEVIGHVAGGGDALVLMPTGSGKSLCYQVPALLREGMAVVVSPLIALMQDQVAALAEIGVRAAFLNSTLSGAGAAEVEARARRGELDLLYVAPERLMMASCLALLARCRLALIAIDEAHCVSQWGHDFRPEYLQLAVLRERFAGVPRIALTATADAQTRSEILERLELSAARVFVSSFDRPNIRYRIVEKDDARRQVLDFIRAEHAGDAGIVYCLSRRKVDEVAEFLSSRGMTALPYHAGMDAEARRRHQERFQRKEAVVMVATIAFGMGIDKPDVRFVAHLDLPKSVEGYYQETGRAGRDGLPADAWMAYGLQDVVQLRRMIDESQAGEAQKRIQAAKLDAMLGLCETAQCRRMRLLGYFGEASGACGNCDTCLDPPVTFDGTEAAQQLLSCVVRTGQRFGAMHVIDVLRGEATAKVTDRGHERLSTFGIGASRSAREWRAIARQCIALGLLQVDHQAYGALRLTGESRAVLKGERRVSLRAWKEGRRIARPRVAKEEISSEHLALFERLRAWRAETARSRGVPAYVVFHDATLADIARAKPASREALRRISGVGARKLEAYGAELLELVSAG
ncbi:MAG TPA: DNA helicase RecQ [Burkholderiales bacterium]|nr:DNA helicase RecQ [Burkholderiales bacterium]